MGYLELDIELCGVVVPKRGVLVVKDSGERKSDMCGLSGTNVLCHVPATSEALRSMTDAEDTPQESGWLSPHFRPRTLDHGYPRERILWIWDCHRRTFVHCHYRKRLDIEHISGIRLVSGKANEQLPNRSDLEPRHEDRYHPFGYRIPSWNG